MKNGQGFSIKEDKDQFRELLFTQNGLKTPTWAYSKEFEIQETMWLFGALCEVLGRNFVKVRFHINEEKISEKSL